jgi:hypothetical protein
MYHTFDMNQMIGDLSALPKTKMGRVNAARMGRL